MQIEIVPIDSIFPDPANVRTHSDRNLAAIAASLKRFKQQKPIVVDGDGIVRAGNGTLEAARSLGWTMIEIVRTELKGSEAVSFAIADNRVGDPEIGSGWDTNALAETLRALQSNDADLATVTGFNATEIASLLGAGLGDIGAGMGKAAGKEFDESCADGVETTTCPHCGKEFPL